MYNLNIIKYSQICVNLTHIKTLHGQYHRIRHWILWRYINTNYYYYLLLNARLDA